MRNGINTLVRIIDPANLCCDKKNTFTSKIKNMSNVLFNLTNFMPADSGETTIEEIQEMRFRYEADQITGIEPNAQGFYLDQNVITMIQTNPNIKSLYLYLGKRRDDPANDPKYDGRYTVIAIPATKTGTLDTLILAPDKNYEWHDPISMHQPTNRNLILPKLPEPIINR